MKKKNKTNKTGKKCMKEPLKLKLNDKLKNK